LKTQQCQEKSIEFFKFLMILAPPMILLRNDIQLKLNDIIFVLVFIRRSEYISPIGANIIDKTPKGVIFYDP